MLQTATAGAVCLNGRMAGEVDAQHPLPLPVSPFGTLTIELRPYEPGVLPLSLRLPLTHGMPAPDHPDPRMSIALWPGGILEIELLPEHLPAPARFIAQTDSLRFFYQDGSPPHLLCDGAKLSHKYPLPHSALPPSLTPLPGALLLTGECGDGDSYALLLAPDAASLLLSVTGRNITPLDGGAALRLIRPAGDSVGHASLETWACAPSGWRLAASEPVWAQGAPVRPTTPEATAIAAVEAAQLGRMQEAAAYFAPETPHADPLERAAGFDGCVPLRYPLPGGLPAVGLMRLKDHFLQIVPAVYAHRPGGLNGGFLLTQLEIHENAQM